jgi:hypothetical protein
MRKYELQESVTLRTGRFRLTPEQYANRRYVVRLVSDPPELIVEPITEISFKRGEVVETDFDVPRAMESKMRPLVPELPADVKPIETSASASSDPAAGDDSPGDVSAADDSEDPLAGVDLGGSATTHADTPAEHRPGRRSRGK